jgi:hypothetical protein
MACRSFPGFWSSASRRYGIEGNPVHDLTLVEARQKSSIEKLKIIAGPGPALHSNRRLRLLGAVLTHPAVEFGQRDVALGDIQPPHLRVGLNQPGRAVGIAVG